MYKTGVFPGKFLPPHRGHLNSIINAATKCETLYVVVSDSKDLTKKLCKKDNLPLMPLKTRAKWLSIELQGFDHIRVLMLDETDIPDYPYGWSEWAKLLKDLIPSDIDVIFGGEREYIPQHNKNFPGIKYELFDYNRERYPISATKIRQDPFKHWDYILGSVRPFFAKRVLISGTESCVDGETEFFNGSKWKKISEYAEGDMVLQFNKDYTAEIVYPERYIKEPTTKLYKLQNSYGNWSQVYSDDHDIVYITSKGHLSKEPFKEVINKHMNNKYGFQGKLLNWFNYNGQMSIAHFPLRLMVAISADGTDSKSNWRIRLIKKEKIKRLRWIIESCGIELDERVYADGYHNFYVPKKYGYKIFPSSLMHLDKKSKEIFIDEIFKWDGWDKSYYSTIKENIDIVQFIITSLGIRTNIYKDKREDKTTCYRLDISSNKYTTIDINSNNEEHRSKMISEFIPNDGFKYCFTVPSGMLVLRRDNHIFITGNCGKTTMTKYLGKIYLTSWTEEEGRYYSHKYLGGNEEVWTVQDFDNIAYLQRDLEYKALKSANKVAFFDTSALVTQYYLDLYMGEKSSLIDEFIDPDRFDIVLLFKPDVKWVDDGLRWNSDQEERVRLHEKLKNMYIEYGFKDKIVEIDGNYRERLEQTTSIVDNLLKESY